ncbi:hypothetical protein GTP23_07750 [Pseudoduganella sp. FT93W]|uniref:Uncharacterized protein n=1 Tax=Duganella fentianensis TaxID=2692177 RepID=A0A845HVS9_9BURK|nr:hypothetical protein [Duganella fentianensis]MYN44962.1 hypothetical protein [Duganella fentianensis]
MTRFSSPSLYQCPACAAYFTRASLISLHFDKNVPEWSDGKSGQWWSGASATVGRCPSCSGIVWIADVTAIMEQPTAPREIHPLARLWHRITGDRQGRLRKEREWAALPAGIKEARGFGGLESADDLIEALDGLSPDAADDREIFLRRRLWWASSEHQRTRNDGVSAASLPLVAPELAHTNRLRLLALFELDAEAPLERGELLRQLGRFAEAMAVLKAVQPDGYSEIKASKIERLARAGIVELRDLKAV